MVSRGCDFALDALDALDALGALGALALATEGEHYYLDI